MNPKKRKLYRKMIGAAPAGSDIKTEMSRAGNINIQWTFVAARKIYKAYAYKVSFKAYDSYTVNVFKNKKCIALFWGPGKARKLIEHAIAIQGKSR